MKQKRRWVLIFFFININNFVGLMYFHSFLFLNVSEVLLSYLLNQLELLLDLQKLFALHLLVIYYSDHNLIELRYHVKL